MKIKSVQIQWEHFADWVRLRKAVYTGIDRAIHEKEVETIYADHDKMHLLAVAEDGQIWGMIEVSLRNVVHGCLVSPVGYAEEIFVDPPD